MKINSSILALFLSLASSVDSRYFSQNHRATYSPISFAEAAADAKQRAGSDSFAFN